MSGAVAHELEVNMETGDKFSKLSTVLGKTAIYSLLAAVGFAFLLFAPACEADGNSKVKCEAPSSTKPWKYDVDIWQSTEYSAGPMDTALYRDKDDRIWLPVQISFGYVTDAYRPRTANHILLSEDKGLTWKFTDLKWPKDWPGPRHNSVKLSDGTIIEIAWAEIGGWQRYRRSEIRRLEKQGYYVWDLGEDQGYCAIIHEVWMRRSSDGGKGWEEKTIHQQFPFFAHLVPRSLKLLKDDSILLFLYGYNKVGHDTDAYIARSADHGDTWKLIKIADGRHSPTNAFNETFPVVFNDGRVFVMLRTRTGVPAYFVRSYDGGKTWSKPRPTPIKSKHPNVTLLANGTILCTYQIRHAKPFGVRARFTSDMGDTWSAEVIIRDDIPIGDGLYEPRTVELSDGTLFTVAGAQKIIPSGQRCGFLCGARWARDYRRPMSPKLLQPPLKPKFNVPAEGENEKSPWQKERELQAASR